MNYGTKMRLTSHNECFHGLYLKNLNNRGYLGISARNSDRYPKDVQVDTITINNHDPNFYKHEDQLTNPDATMEDTPGEQERV